METCKSFNLFSPLCTCMLTASVQLCVDQIIWHSVAKRYSNLWKVPFIEASQLMTLFLPFFTSLKKESPDKNMLTLRGDPKRGNPSTGPSSWQLKRPPKADFDTALDTKIDKRRPRANPGIRRPVSPGFLFYFCGRKSTKRSHRTWRWSRGRGHIWISFRRPRWSPTRRIANSNNKATFSTSRAIRCRCKIRLVAELSGFFFTMKRSLQSLSKLG